MKRYEYLTERIRLGKLKLVERLDALLQERSQEGWRLVNFEFSDLLSTCVVVFEKEAGEV